MKLFFNPQTGKFIDITVETPTELIYHFSYILDEQTYPEHYDMHSDDSLYQIGPQQLTVGRVPDDILDPNTLLAIEKVLKNNFYKPYFKTGINTGRSDGNLYGKRMYMSNLRSVPWTFLLGYEYGILMACYEKQHS